MIGGYYDAYTPANDTWMIHRNVLGSTSMVTDHAGTEISDVADYPWGDVWFADASKEYHFAGFNYRFSALGIDPAINREYEYGLGRWLSPDRLGGDVTNPQSLNRYAYVLNNPTTLSDPLGLNQDCSFDTTVWPYKLTCPLGDNGNGDGVGVSAGGCAPIYVNGGYAGSTCGKGTGSLYGQRSGGGGATYDVMKGAARIE
jgi:RHS repeat-associated protein